MKIIGMLLGAAVVFIVILITIDIASTPKATKGQCVLAKRMILPDICVNSCSPAFDCTASTRPYGFFFTQAATCDDAVICMSRRSAGTMAKIDSQKKTVQPEVRASKN